jgi:hypothetical protein
MNRSDRDAETMAREGVTPSRDGFSSGRLDPSREFWAVPASSREGLLLTGA